MFKFFKKETAEQFFVPDFIVFNVDNFNTWFNAKNNNAVYAHPGIFLRTDKLSVSHITDYLIKCYNFKPQQITDSYDKIIELYDSVVLDWRKKLNNSGK